MADTTLNDVLGLDFSEYTTTPYNIKNEPAEKKQVMSMSDVLRGTTIGKEWKTPSIDTLTTMRDRVPTVAEDAIWSLGTNTVRGIKNIVPALAIDAMTKPIETAGGLAAGAAGWSAGSALGASAVSSIGLAGWWGTALGGLASVTAGVAGGLGAAYLVGKGLDWALDTEDENPLTPKHQKTMLRVLDKMRDNGEITEEEYTQNKDAYLTFIQNAQKTIEDASTNAKEKNDVVDMLVGREYPDGNIVDSVIAWGAKALKDDQDFYDYAVEQRQMNPQGFANVFGGIVGNLVPYYATAYLYRAALTTPKLKTVFQGNRFRENIVEIPTNLSREQVTEKVGALAKAYTTAQMGAEYTAENVLKYIERTGDVNLENYEPSSVEGAMAGAYGRIGAITEFELGGVEPLIIGVFKKVGLKLPTAKVAIKTLGQEAYEETVQNLTQFLAGKVDGTETRTWGEFLSDTLQAAGWAAFTGGTIGTMTHRINRANLVKGIVKYGNGAITEEQATQVADTMIEMVEETMDYRKNERLEKLKSYVSAIYEDIDMPEAEKADAINTIASLEYALVSQWNTINGTDIADDPLFKGEVNALGWFRTGIPATQKEAIDAYFAELAENEKKLKNLEDWLKKAQEANNQELVKELGQQLDEIESKLEVLRSDKYRLDLLGDLVAEDKRAIALELRKRKQELKAKQKNKDQNIVKELDAAIADQKAGVGGVVTLEENAPVEQVKDFSLPFFDGEITTYYKNGNIKPKVLEKIYSLFTEEELNNIPKYYSKTLREIISNSFGKEHMNLALKSSASVEMIKDAAKRAEITPFQMYNAIRISRGLEPVADTQTPDVEFQDEVFKIADENARLDDIYPAYDGETIEVDGKERTVYNSEGKRIAKSAEALTNFWKWFGDSKVVDGEGRPLVVYHGTNAEFDSFNKSRTGIFFNTTKKLSELYGTELYSVYLKIENPFIVPKKEFELNGIKLQPNAFDTINIQAEKMGYDGVINKDVYDSPLPQMGSFLGDNYTVFEPTQIKSVDNRGTFSSDTGNIYYQIDKTEAKSPLLYNDPEYRSKRVYIYDKNWDKHIIEPGLVLFDGSVMSITTLANSNFPNNEVWALYKSEGGESVDSFKNIFYYLQQNIAEVIRGPEGEIKGSYERLSDAENKDVLLKALDKTKTYLTRMDGPELKSQIAVLNNLIDNIKDGYIKPQFIELVTLSDGTHLVTHGISGSPEKVEKFIKDGKVYNPSLYIAEKPSEYGFRSVVLFAKPDILKRKDAKIFDRDAYTSTLSREPTKETIEMPSDEVLEKAVDIFDKYFDLEYNLYYKHSGSTFGDFALTMESGLENIKDPYYWNSFYVDKEFVKRYIIADAIERGLANVDKEQLYKSQNNGFPLDVATMAKAFDVPMSDHTLTDVADKALELIAKQENKTRDEVLDSYKKLAVSRKKVVKSTGADATPENIAQAQREHKDHFGRWRDVYEEIHNGRMHNAAYELLDTTGESGIIASIFTREIPFDAMVAEKRKTGRHYQSVESRKKIRKYAIMAAKGNLIAHGKIYAAFLPMRPKTNVRGYMNEYRNDINSMFGHGDAEQVVAEIEKMAKRFAKIYKTLTPEEQKKLTTGKVEENSELETKLKQALEKNGVKDDLVIDYALKLMEEVYDHPVTYFEGKILADVDISDFIGAYVKDGEAWNSVARMLQNKGLTVVRGEPTDVKWATIKLEEKLGQDIRFQNRVSGAAPATYRGAYIPALRFILKANRMDASSLSHELAHDWFEVYVSHAQSGNASKEFMRSWGVLEKALGIDLTKPGSLSKASEIFARAYEAWIMDKKDWAKSIAIADKDKEELGKLFKNYQNHLRDIYNTIANPYFQITWGKVGELKPELRDWFDRMTEIKSLEGMVERGEITQEQANQERINQAIDTVIANTDDPEAKRALENAKVLNDTNRYEAEGGNKNALQRRIATLAKAIDENNMLIKENYDTHRDMLEVAKAADNFVRTRLDDALAIINGQMAEQEGLFKEDIYTALERLALENGDLNLLDELKNSEIANRLAKELGQRVAGFRNWTAGDLDVVSTVKMLDNKFNKALKNKKAQNLLKEATEMFESAQKEQDKLADKQLESFLKDVECK